MFVDHGSSVRKQKEIMVPTLRLTLREPEIDTNRPLTEGTVSVEGFTLAFGAESPDAWDQGMGALLPAVAEGAPWICIPAYPNRKFRHSYIQIRTDAGIVSPQDLEGRRVGILSWDNTAGIWARGALQNYYGVDLTSIQWCSVKDGVVRERAGCKISPIPGPHGSSDALLNDLMLSGELDAVIAPNVLPAVSRRDPRVRRLFTDYKNEEQAYFRATGIFPISHVVAMRADFVGRYPGAPVALLTAYRRARDVAFERIEGSDPAVLTISWANAAMEEQRQLMGDNYWSYNVADNRPALDSFVRFSLQQGVIAEPVDCQSLFDPQAAALAGW